MRRTRRLWAALLLSCLLLAGCWDRRELEEHSTVLASGVDLCAEGDSEGCRLVVTRQIAIPGRIPLGGGEGMGGVRDTVTVIRSPGKDGPDSARRTQAALHRKISFGHIRILVFSEEFAHHGMTDFVQYVRRIPEARRLLWVAVSEGPAEQVIRSQPSLERVPALFLSDMFEDAVKTGRLPNIYWGDFLARISNKGEETIAPLIRMPAPDHPALTGLAVFLGHRMVGKLNLEETATYMEMRGLKRGGELLAVPLPNGGKASLTVYGRKARWRLGLANGRIRARVRIDLEADLNELSVGLRSSDPAVAGLIEREAARLVSRRATALTARLQKEFKSDILGLGELVRAHLPQAWAGIRDWNSDFARAQLSFDVQVSVRRTGMTMD
ncbi:MAG TPA: Ger(x)C family spore germination protein [Symbiobacteriaceae bacterium]|nr:Ger(x)C family spore germination protein [Symbiobacteriaceae bacterium]